MRKWFRRLSAAFLILAASCAPAYVVITPLDQPLPAPVPLVIGEIVDAMPPTAPPEERPKPEAIQKLRKTLVEYLSGAKAPVGPDGKDVKLFSQVTLTEAAVAMPQVISPTSELPDSAAVSSHADSMAATREDPRPAGNDLLVTGKVLSYKKGSHAARFFLGFGAGKGEVVVQLALRQARQDLFVGNFRGEVSSGMEGNDVPIRQVSQEFTTALKKSWRPLSLP